MVSQVRPQQVLRKPRFILSWVLGAGGTPCRAPWGSLGMVERQDAGARGEAWLGLASVKGFSRLPAVGVVSSGQLSGPGMIKAPWGAGARQQMPLDCQRYLYKEPLLSKDELALRGPSLPSQKFLKMSQHHNIQKIKKYKQYKAALGFTLHQFLAHSRHVKTISGMNEFPGQNRSVLWKRFMVWWREPEVKTGKSSRVEKE